MNKEEKIYQFNEYVLGYDKGRNDRSCLTISKVQNGNIYVMSSLLDGSADVISTMLDGLQEELKEKDKEIDNLNKQLKWDYQEINRLRNIINELEKYIKENSWYYNTIEGCQWVDQFKILDKLKELKEGR